jgi:hypothetical protein
MSYLLDKTNNSSSKITVEDGTIDNTSTPLTLIGRAFVGWGEAVNENFLALLENFASDTSPRNAVAGQLWYDTTSARLKYFNGVAYNVVASFPPLTEGFLYNNDSNVMSWIPNYTMAARILPTNSTGGLNAYLQRTSTGDLTWVTGASLLTDALPSGNGFLTKNADGTYSLTATNTIALKSDLAGVGGYTLPTASTSMLGGVKIDGTTITINSGIISAVSSGGTTLPAQTGNSGKYLTTNGTTLSWGTASSGGGGPIAVLDFDTNPLDPPWTTSASLPALTVKIAVGATVTRVAGSSPGRYLVTFATARANANYVAIVTMGWNASHSPPDTMRDNPSYYILNQTASGFEIYVNDDHGMSPIPMDTDNIGVAVFDATSVGGGGSGGGGTTLPTQSGNNGKFLTTDGTTLSWGTTTGGGSVTSATVGTAIAGLAGEAVGTYAILVPKFAVTGADPPNQERRSGSDLAGSRLVYGLAGRPFNDVTGGSSGIHNALEGQLGATLISPPGTWRSMGISYYKPASFDGSFIEAFYYPSLWMRIA